MPHTPRPANHPCLAGLLTLLLLAACGGGGDPVAPPTPPAAVASVRLTPASLSLVAGTTAQLTATPLDAGGAALTGRAVSWNSDATTIASVNSAGLVAGVTPGTARIRATSEGVSTEVTVTVTPVPVANIVITPAAPSLETGDTLRLTATARDAQGNTLPDRTIQWTAVNTAIANVTTSGLVTALAPGTTLVRASSETVTQEITLTVTQAAVATVKLSRDTATLVPNQPLLLTATLTDVRNNTLTGRTIGWSSSNQTIVSVTTGGAIAAVAPGTATITATAESKSASVVITVVPGGWIGPNGGTVTAFSGALSLVIDANALAAFTAITVAPFTAPTAHPRLLSGTSFVFGPDGLAFAKPVSMNINYPSASLGSANARNLRLHRYAGGTWTPVTVSAVNTGTRTVTGTINTFSSYAIVELPPVASVTLTSVSAPLAVNETLTLVATLRDATNAVVAERDITWTSSNSAIVNVSQTGVLTAVAIGGPVTITATSEGKSASTVVSVTEQFRLRDIGTGEDHSCALDVNGAAWCWGDGEDGRFGTGVEDVSATHIPVRVSGGHVFTSIAVGGEFNCALKNTGAAFCWGVSTWGAVGDGTDDDRYVPTPVAGGHTFTQLSAGKYHACGLSAGGVARCWGANFNGAVGDGSTTERDFPTLVSGGHTFTTIAAGANFTCALTTDGEPWCWGENVYGQLGDGTISSRAAPVRVLGDHRFVAIAAGGWHTCAVKQNGEAWCWGNGKYGSVGDGASLERRTPVRVSGAFQFTSIITGEDHSCGLLTSGVAACWGYNNGAVGDGTLDDRHSPVLVSGGLMFSKLAASYAETTCALTPAGVGYCWGDNDYGEANDDSSGEVLEPLRVVAPNMAAVRAANRAANQNMNRVPHRALMRKSAGKSKPPKSQPRH